MLELTSVTIPTTGRASKDDATRASRRQDAYLYTIQRLPLEDTMIIAKHQNDIGTNHDVTNVDYTSFQSMEHASGQ